MRFNSQTDPDDTVAARPLRHRRAVALQVEVTEGVEGDRAVRCAGLEPGRDVVVEPLACGGLGREAGALRALEADTIRQP